MLNTAVPTVVSRYSRTPESAPVRAAPVGSVRANAAPQSEAAAGLLPSGPERRGGEEAPLLPNWREVREGEGADARVYYHCSLTGESCLERPSL